MHRRKDNRILIVMHNKDGLKLDWLISFVIELGESPEESILS